MTYGIFWNGKRVNTAESKEAAKQIVRGTDRDYGPLPKGTLTYQKVRA